MNSTYKGYNEHYYSPNYSIKHNRVPRSFDGFHPVTRKQLMIENVFGARRRFEFPNQTLTEVWYWEVKWQGLDDHVWVRDEVLTRAESAMDNLMSLVVQMKQKKLNDLKQRWWKMYLAKQKMKNQM